MVITDIIVRVESMIPDYLAIRPRDVLRKMVI